MNCKWYVFWALSYSMQNSYRLILIAIFLFFLKAEEICKIKNWWELIKPDFNPSNICLYIDKDNEEKKELLIRTCHSNITEYKDLIQNVTSNITDYEFIVYYFLIDEENMGEFFCYDREKKIQFLNFLNIKVNQVLPRKNERVFNILKFINLVLNIPIATLKVAKTILLSGISYLAYKKY